MNIYLQYIPTAVMIGTAFGVGITYFFRSKSSSSGEALSLLEQENKIFRDQLHKKEEDHAKEVKEIRAEFTKQVSELTERFGFMQGKYEKEKEDREKWEAIAKDKNPETKEFMTFMVSTQKEVVTILKEIHIMLQQEAEREIKVDTHSTISKN